jgi:hypothetical protein
MSIDLTDAQIVRVLELTASIASIKSSMPRPPAGYTNNPDVNLEIAKALRSALEAQNDVLIELGALLR